MNKNTIDWCDASWNPIVGCNNGCPYCYAHRIYRRFKKSFKPTFYPERLKELYKIKKPSRIFVGSVTDFWSDGVRPEWRKRVFKAIRDNPKHTYFVLTKKPHKIPLEERKTMPKNLWLGVSIDTCNSISRWITISNGTFPKSLKKFICFEPLLGKIDDLYIYILRGCIPDWIIIGGLTGCQEKTNPEWVSALLKSIPEGIPIFIKGNLNRKPKLQQFPK